MSRHIASSMEELQAFYEACLPSLDRAMHFSFPPIVSIGHAVIESPDSTGRLTDKDPGAE